MTEPVKYRVFKRSATSFKTFASARKITVERNLTNDEAIRCCKNFNDNRSSSQIKRGTKYEFEGQ